MSRDTTQLIIELKEAGQDFEWYPTTQGMIDAVKKKIPSNASSLMDIGAGDGRVLQSLAEKGDAPLLYAIEISPVLRGRWAEEIIPVGTDLFEQNLSALPVDYIFSNPKYSEYEEWVCKIVSEGFAKKAFLVIPERWVNSNAIDQALKRRGADARVIHHDDFSSADRQSRAVIDIVEVSFPKECDYRENVKDPFDIWFNQNIEFFDKAGEFKESESESQLARRFSNATIVEMVEAYLDEYRLLESNYRSIFKLDSGILKELGVNKDAIRSGLKTKISGLKTKYWRVLFTRIDAITSRLTTGSREKLLRKLTGNTSVEFTASNAYSIILWAIQNANKYFDDQLIDLFFELSTFEGVLNYKSNTRAWVKDGWRYTNTSRVNTHYVLDYRFVVTKWRTFNKETYGKWDYPGNLHKDCHNLIADVIAVLSNLGFLTSSEDSLDRTWHPGEWEDFYLINSGDILFQVKAYKNGNMHFRFNQDAIKTLNINVGRLLKWVRTAEDVAREMDIPQEEAQRFFNRNQYILPTKLKLLA